MYKELFPIFVAAYLGAFSGPLGGRSSCAPTVRVVGGSSVFWYFASLICDFMPAANDRSRFQLQKFLHLALQGDLPATPIPVDLCISSLSLWLGAGLVVCSGSVSVFAVC